MADNSKLELVIEVDSGKANASIKSINTGLSSMEAQAVQTARQASGGIDGMTASMVKGATAGNLLADSIKSALNWAKEWTVGAAQAAAHVDKMTLSMASLAKANGISTEASNRAVEAVKKVGFSTQDAIHTVDRLVIANLGLEKAQGLAKIAKDAAAIENITAPEALEKILQSIEFGNARALRSAGLRVDFAHDLQIKELQLGRTLSENEQVQLRYNAVQKAAANIQGAAAAAAGSAEAQSAALAREVTELREAIGEQFQGQLKAWVGHLRDLLGFLRENSDSLVKLGEGALAAVGVYGLIIAATKAWAAAQAGLNLALGAGAAMAANPWALGIGAALAGGAVIAYSYNQMQQSQQQQFGTMRGDQIRAIAGQAGGLAKLKAQGVSEEDIRLAITGSRQAGDLPFAAVPKVAVEAGPDVDALKLAAEIRKKQAENERFFADRAVAAGGAGKTGFAKEAAEMSAAIAGRTSILDEHGKLQQVGLTPAALASIMEEATKKFDAYKEHVVIENHKVIAEQLKDEEALWAKQLEFDSKLLEARLHHNREAADHDYEQTAKVYAFEEQRAGFARDAQVRNLDALDPQTIQAKVAVEQAKANIEIEYLEKVHEVKQRLYDIDTSRALMEEQLDMQRLGYKADEIAARINDLSQQRQDIRDQAEEANGEALQGARENASIKATSMIRDHNKQIFESLKQQAGGVFDALLTKSQSVWAAIGNSLKTALLTAIKDVVTSRVAAMLMGIVSGSRVSFAGNQPVFGGGGAAGGLAGGMGILGALGIGGSPGGGGGAGVGQAVQMAGGGGGGYSAMATGGAGGSSGGFGGLSGMLKNGAAGLKNFVGLGSNVSVDSQGALWKTVGNQSHYLGSGVGGRLSAIGHSDAALAGGAALAMDGLIGHAGTWRGIGEGAAGGAMIGFNFGGPLGALVGGLVGAGIGIGEKIAGVESKENEAKRLVKQLYNVSIDNALAKQIADIAKQKYSGHVSMAVRDPDVRKTIELYAAASGQRMPLSATTPRGAGLTEQGGNLYQTPSYLFGNPNVYQSSLPTAGGQAAGMIPGPMSLQLHVSGQGAAQFVAGQVVTPEFVQSQWSSAAASSNGRVQNSAWMQQPGLVIS